MEHYIVMGTGIILKGNKIKLLNLNLPQYPFGVYCLKQ